MSNVAIIKKSFALFNNRVTGFAEWCIVVCLAMTTSLSYAAVNKYDSLIADFDSKPSVAIANKFFKAMLEEDIMDEKYVLGDATPIDSVCQEFYYWAGEWLNECQEYERARQYGLKALELYKYNNDEKAYCLNLLGVVSVRLGDFASGVSYSKQCVDIDMRSGDNDKIALSLSTLAGTYIAADKPKDAEKYIMMGLEYAANGKNTLRQTILLGMASEVNYKMGDYTKALNFAEQAYRLDSVAARWPRAAIRLSQKATALIGMERYAEAEATFEKAFPLLRDANNYHSLAIDYNHLGFMMLKQHRHSDAVPYFKEASRLFAAMGDLYNQVHAQKGLYESYWELDRDSARIALERFNELKDSLYHQASADALARYNVEFDTDRLKDEVAKHSFARKRDWMLAAVLIILVVVGSLVCYRRKLRSYRAEMKLLMAEIAEINASMAQQGAAATAATPVDDVPAETAAPSELEQDKTADTAGSASHLERMVVQAVNEGMANCEISVAQIANRLNMGEQTFRRRFVEATGRQPKSFISAIQMGRAASLLSDRNLTIGEVARECGFEEQSAFSHSFKRAFGCAPTEYRANALKQE